MRARELGMEHWNIETWYRIWLSGRIIFLAGIQMDTNRTFENKQKRS